MTDFDPRPPCLGELAKGCSMGNTELLVDTMAAKIAVLKQRLAAAEPPGDHMTACKLDCLMSMLPLLLGGPRAAAVDPAVIQAPVDSSKLMKLEADKATLKAEKKTLEGQCDQLRKENKSLKEENEALKAREVVPPAMSFEEIAKAAFEEQPVAPEAPSADLQAQLEKAIRERDQALAVLEEDQGGDTEEIASLRQQLAQSVPVDQVNELTTRCQKANDDLGACIRVRDDCIRRIEGVLPAAPTLAPSPPPEPGQVIMEDDPVLGQGTCNPLTDTQRSYRIQKWNVTPDPKTGERVPGQTLRSVNSIVSSPLRIPILDDVGSRSLPVLSKDSLEIQRQLGGLVARLKEVYQIMRPEIWTGTNCSELQAQYVNDTKTMLSRLACQLVDAITRKAAANNVSDQVANAIPDALKAPCQETLHARIESLTPGSSAQDAGSAMVSALENLFQTWMTNVEETDASDTIVHGIFCPILSKVGTCTWPVDVSASQALGATWNAAK